jgi:hypothetical protein
MNGEGAGVEGWFGRESCVVVFFRTMEPTPEKQGGICLHAFFCRSTSDRRTEERWKELWVVQEDAAW